MRDVIKELMRDEIRSLRLLISGIRSTCTVLRLHISEIAFCSFEAHLLTDLTLK